MYRHRIIAAFAVLLHAGSGGPAYAESVVRPGPFQAYHVTLEVVRNGVLLGSPTWTMAAGQSSRIELGSPSKPDSLTVQQRVTKFPGFSTKALLQLEFFGVKRGGHTRIAAPTFGIELGRPERFDVKTDEGIMSIRATVEGSRDIPEGAAAGPVGIPYPEI